ncbi:MAG: hypothetical protein Q9221_004053 [Calogaya cf. arnoldii]
MSGPQPQPGPQPGQAPGSEEDRIQALEIHNQCRRDASQSSGIPRPDLIWDDNLAAQAQQWASEMAQFDRYEHSPDWLRENQGENIAASDGRSVTMTEISGSWGPKEKPYYHGEKIPEGDFYIYGHYTQIIWPTTTHVGIACARNTTQSQKWYFVARFSPPGNYPGRDAFNG